MKSNTDNPSLRETLSLTALGGCLWPSESTPRAAGCNWLVELLGVVSWLACHSLLFSRCDGAFLSAFPRAFSGIWVNSGAMDPSTVGAFTSLSKSVVSTVYLERIFFSFIHFLKMLLFFVIFKICGCGGRGMHTWVQVPQSPEEGFGSQTWSYTWL